MANLQVKNVPEPLHRKLRKLAETRGQTVGAVVLDAVRQVVDRQEFRERLKSRERVDLGGAAQKAVRAVREQRERVRSR